MKHWACTNAGCFGTTCCPSMLCHRLTVNECLGVTFALEIMYNKWIDPAKEDIMDVCPAANLKAITALKNILNNKSGPLLFM